MAITFTPDEQAIINDIRQIIDTFGQPVNEQIFSVWRPNESNLGIHIVADSMRTREAQGHMSLSARLNKSILRGSGADEWQIEVHVPTYWKRKP